MTPARRAFGLPPVRPGPVPGYVLIADRNNNRLLLVSPSKHVEWRFPGPSAAYGAFRDPDDAFFTPGYRQIVVNEEFNETVVRSTRSNAGSCGRTAAPASPDPGAVSCRTGRRLRAPERRRAGGRHPELPRRRSSAPHTTSWARSARRERARTIRLGRCSRRTATRLSRAEECSSTEIGGYVDRLDAHGRLVYSLHTPTSYPSDAQLLPNGNILVAGFDTPGRIDELTPSGKVVWTYGPTSGPGSLDRPSLAVRWPNGMIAATDDWHHRIIVIDPHTKRIVWQYGHFGVASSALGYLSKPDGLDLLPAGRPLIRPRAARSRLHITRIGSLPQAASRMSAVALPGGRIFAAGGLVTAGSSTQVLAGRPGSLSRVSPLSTRRSTTPQRPGSARTSTSSAAASRARPTGSAESTRDVDDAAGRVDR